MQVKIDIDHKRREFIDRILDIRNIIENYTNVKFKNFQVFETNKGFHVICDVENIDNVYELILIQLLFGSDPMREALNYVRAKKLGNIEDFSKFNFLFTAKHKIDREKRDTLERFFSDKPTSREKLRKDLEKVLNNG